MSKVYVWGDNSNGQLGLDFEDTSYIEQPRRCCFNITIKSASCGDFHAGLVS